MSQIVPKPIEGKPIECKPLEVKKSISNAPKKQPCDNCGRPAKRDQKTKNSATYLCRVCKCKTVITLRPKP